MCYHQAATLRDHRDEIEAAGYRVVVVGIGNVEGANTFASAVPFPSELLLLDPDRQLHDNFELKSGLGPTFFNKATPDAIQRYTFKAFTEAAKDYKFVRPPTNAAALQQGGTFVLDGDKVIYAHIDQGTADHAPIKDVLASLRAA